MRSCRGPRHRPRPAGCASRRAGSRRSLGVWVVAAGGPLIANALDSPVDEGARDEAQGDFENATTAFRVAAGRAPGDVAAAPGW
jgi:hypothetical protein